MLLLFLVSLLSLFSHADVYDNYAELALRERYGVDYAIVLQNRHASVTVFSVHGGNIERGTSTVADLIAGNIFNRYDFRGLRPGNNLDLHITSTHFDEPQALQIASHSYFGVSIHGYTPRGNSHLKTVCVGGGNTLIANAFAAELSQNPSVLPRNTRIISPCEPHPGIDPLNIVNRCQTQGIQLEMSAALYVHFREHPESARLFADFVQRFVRQTVLH